MNAEKARSLGVDAFCIKPMTAQEMAVTIQQVMPSPPKPQPPSSAHILLIDDDDQLRVMIRRMLESAGHTVVEASNGREGFHRYRDVQPDLILTNLIMPEQEGLETIQAIRRLAPDAKIIAMSGGMRSGALDVLEVARHFGAQVALHKPFSRNELLTAINDTLQG